MINWIEMILFTILAPSSIVLIFILIDRTAGKKWPFGKKQKKTNSGGKFG